MILLSRIARSTRLNNLKQYFWDILVNEFLASYLVPDNFRRVCLLMAGLKLRNASINSHCFIGSRRLVLGSNTYVNRECLFNNEGNATVYIGSDCAIGYRVSFYTARHDYSDKFHRAGQTITEDIRIENGCWIGANSIILSGIRIGEGCVIAAGSVVTENCLPNYLYAGILARAIRKID